MDEGSRQGKQVLAYIISDTVVSRVFYDTAEALPLCRPGQRRAPKRKWVESSTTRQDGVAVSVPGVV